MPGLTLYNANVYTLDESRPAATAIAMEAGRITAVGTDETVSSAASPGSRAIDLAGRTVLPGLADAHGHVRNLGLLSEMVDLRDAGSIEEAVERVRRRAQDTPEGQWIQGRAWNQELWPGRALPTHDLLSEAVPDHPVWLVRVDGHAGWANARAMTVAGVGASAQSPPGGLIVKEGGRLTGLFVDRAMGLVRDRIPGLTVQQSKESLLAAQDQCLAAGLTQVHDAGIDGTILEAYRQLVDEGRLKMRVYAMLARDFFDTAEVEAVDEGLFICRSVKIVSDGALGSRGAALFEPYDDEPGQRGFMLLSREELQATADRAFTMGFQVNTHAIGDLANHESLNAIESALERHDATDHRSRIEHAQILALADIPRFAALGVIASIQPTHCTSDMFMADSRLGAERVAGAYPWRKLLDAGVRLVGGSDFPVESCNPLWGIYSAVTRQDHDGRPAGGWRPEERLTMAEALRSFTTDAAYASFQERDLGTLSPGMMADMVVLDTDIVNAGPQALLEARVLATIVNGETVFSADPALPAG